MTTAQFDEVIHAPHRLRICALLAELASAEFAMIRAHVALSDSALSKHLATLESHGYVTVTKFGRDGRTYTTASLTTRGRSAYRGHVAALEEIVAASRGAAL